MSARRPPLRCRIGLHAWEDVACADGRYLRRCTACPPRDDPRVREDPHGYGFQLVARLTAPRTHHSANSVAANL